MSKSKGTLTDKLLKGSFIIVLFTLLSSPLGYFVRMIFSRALTTEEYGLMYAMLSFFALLTMFNDLGFGHAVAYYIPQYLEKKKFNFCWTLYKYDQIIESVTSFLIGIVLYLSSSFWVEHFFKQDEARLLLVFFSAYLIANGFVSSVQKLFLGFQEEKYYSSIEFSRMLVTAVLAVSLYATGNTSIYWYALAFVMGNIATALFYTVLAGHKYSKFKTQIFWDRELFVKAYKYAVPTFLASSLYVIIHYTDMIFLTLFQPIEIVGVYNIIFPIFSILIFIVQPVNKIFLPLSSELKAKNDRTSLQLLVNQILSVFPYLGVYFSIFVYIFPETIITILFGEKWIADAAQHLQLMSILYLPIGMNMYITAMVNGLGRVKERFHLAIFLAILSIIAGGVGAYLYSITGIIIANAIVFLLSVILQLRIIKKDIQFSVPFKKYVFMGVLLLLGITTRQVIGAVEFSFLEIILVGILYSAAMILLSLVLGVIDQSILKYFFKKGKRAALPLFSSDIE